jgi:ketosteroid isomerase-like protein
MYKATVRRLVRRGVRALNSGDPGPLLASFSDDAVLAFPGQSSWAGEYRGKPAIEQFVRRFHEAGLRGEVRDIVVNGPPWRMTVCALFVDRATGGDGATIYENRAILVMHGKWGKIVSQEDFLDTQKVAAFDEVLRAG